MAYVGFSKPYIAALDNEKTKKYSRGFKCGKGMNINITPNYGEGKLYADNQLTENEKEFKDGTITLGTDRLPKEADEVCFGHEVKEDGSVTYRTGDKANYVGVGFNVDEILDGVKRYVAIVLYKVKFGEGADDYTTKGENIEFKTPSISGTISGLSSTEWKDRKVFDTEAEAEAWVKEVLCIPDDTAGGGVTEEEAGA